MHGKPHTPPRESRAFQHDERIAARKGIDMLAPKHKGATQRPRGKKGLVVQSATGGACEPSPRMLRGCRRIREYQRSEENTSELQSLMRISYAVFFMEKKKITAYTPDMTK